MTTATARPDLLSTICTAVRRIFRNRAEPTAEAHYDRGFDAALRYAGTNPTPEDIARNIDASYSDQHFEARRDARFFSIGWRDALAGKPRSFLA